MMRANRDTGARHLLIAIVFPPHYQRRPTDTVQERYDFRLCRDVETVRYVDPAHKGVEPRNTERRYASLGWVRPDARNCKLVFVIDDVLASWEHYSAMRRLLRENVYGMFMCGMFLARIP